MKSAERTKWIEAMDFELQHIKDNGTYKIRRTKNGNEAIGCRWAFEKKLDKDGTVIKFKARLFAKGYLQIYCKDYKETFAPVAKFKSIRLLMTIAVHKGQTLFHDDVTGPFLNGILKEKVLMDQPEGYASGYQDNKWELQKTLYGRVHSSTAF